MTSDAAADQHGEGGHDQRHLVDDQQAAFKTAEVKWTTGLELVARVQRSA
jgi:hypothetical protein